MLLSLYKTAFRVSTPLIEAHLKKRAAAGREDVARAHERHGQPKLPRGKNPVVWFHAASVGESLSLLAIIARLLEEYPRHDVMVTTGTVTSAKLMAERLPARAFHQYIPVDHPLWVESFLEHWHPDFVVWSESELWPNILMAVKRRHIPAVLLNARMSEASFRKWRWAKGSIADILSAFSLCLAQNEAEAGRLRTLGAKNVKVSANLKYAAAPLPFDPEKLAALETALAGRPRLLWASTHPGEEDVAKRLHQKLKAKMPGLLTVIAPRHPRRGSEIKTMLEKDGLRVVQRSTTALPGKDSDIYLADTMGEIGLLCRLSKLVIVGGSFVPIGGHNPIEPGQAGCVIFYGPHMQNFISICDDFESRHAALRLKDEDDLTARVGACLDDPAQFAPMAAAAEKWTREKSHIANELMAELNPFLQAVS